MGVLTTLNPDSWPPHPHTTRGELLAPNGGGCPLVGKFRLGGQAGCHLVPGRQAWAPPDQPLPQRYLVPPSPKCPSWESPGSEERGSPSRASSYFSSASPLPFPIIGLPPEEGPEAPSAARQALSPNRGGGSNQGEGERQGGRLLHTKCSLKDGRALPSPPSSQAALLLGTGAARVTERRPPPC